MNRIEIKTEIACSLKEGIFKDRYLKKEIADYHLSLAERVKI